MRLIPLDLVVYQNRSAEADDRQELWPEPYPFDKLVAGLAGTGCRHQRVDIYALICL
jgi:hypothetical protein